MPGRGRKRQEYVDFIIEYLDDLLQSFLISESNLETFVLCIRLSNKYTASALLGPE